MDRLIQRDMDVIRVIEKVIGLVVIEKSSDANTGFLIPDSIWTKHREDIEQA